MKQRFLETTQAGIIGKLFWKFSQNSQEDTGYEAIFHKLTKYLFKWLFSNNVSKKNTLKGVSLRVLQIFNDLFSEEI